MELVAVADSVGVQCNLKSYKVKGSSVPLIYGKMEQQCYHITSTSAVVGGGFPFIQVRNVDPGVRYCRDIDR